MRLVPHAARPPHRCAAIPFLSNSNARGFFDTGCDLPGWDPHVYLSIEAVEQMAQMLGWAPTKANAGVVRQLDEAKKELQESQERVAELEGQLAAVATLQHAGFKTTKRKAAA